MISLDQYLTELVSQGRVDAAEASQHASSALAKVG
jgi:hypothetical protein